MIYCDIIIKAKKGRRSELARTDGAACRLGRAIKEINREGGYQLAVSKPPSAKDEKGKILVWGAEVEIVGTDSIIKLVDLVCGLNDSVHLLEKFLRGVLQGRNFEHVYMAEYH